MSPSAECRIRSWEVSDTKSQADWMPTHKQTELSRIKQKLELNRPSLWWVRHTRTYVHIHVHIHIHIHIHIYIYVWMNWNPSDELLVFSCNHWTNLHDGVIKWKHFPRYWPFVCGIHRSTVNSPHKGQCRGALIFPLEIRRINGWVNNREAGDLRLAHAHYDVIVMRMWHSTDRYHLGS